MQNIHKFFFLTYLKVGYYLKRGKAHGIRQQQTSASQQASPIRQPQQRVNRDMSQQVLAL